MSEHTKTPWSEHNIFVWGPSQEPVAVTSRRSWKTKLPAEECQANARHIVHCVNNHEKLVEALSELLKESESAQAEGRFIVQAEDKASALLAALEAEKGGEL